MNCINVSVQRIKNNMSVEYTKLNDVNITTYYKIIDVKVTVTQLNKINFSINTVPTDKLVVSIKILC